jgi:peptidoglycan hydrolase-like protein with peptidoglycan-binding domain
VPQAVLFLPRVRRAAALVLVAFAASMLLIAGGASAAEGTTTGGTTAAAPVKAKKVTTKAIQKALGIRADGAMGPKTRRAIKRFQKAHGIKADGVAGPQTLQALGLAGPTTNGALDSAPAAAPADAATVLAKIAQCESGGNIAAVSPSGQYRGKYQFSQQTWEALGGTGDPAEADEGVQDMFAARLYADRGLAPWPACSAAING